MSVKILTGDCRNVLATLAADSVHCCVTSPPYWGLRDYGVPGQIGLESTFPEFISEMVKVFREVRRVLRPDGTCWINLGDSYASSGPRGNGGWDGNNKNSDGSPRLSRQAGDSWGGSTAVGGLKPKDLCGIPWRVALALQEDGWWLRQDIIWSKPNPMPESVTDRCTKAHEYVFLLSKSSRYYFDAETIREPHADPERGAGAKKDGYGGSRIAGFENEQFVTKWKIDESARSYNPNGRNKRSVWEIATSPFPEAHFATFPPALVEPCIKAGTSEKGCCGKCGAPWVRATAREFKPQGDVSLDRGVRGADGQKPMDTSNSWEGFPRGTTRHETTGWSPTCTCHGHFEEFDALPDRNLDPTEKRRKIRIYMPHGDQPPPVPCTVLDPFGGAGTTGLVADRLQRNSVIIELNPQYVEMQKRRISDDAPLFANLTEAAE
jgi:DNA modification methylase